MTSTRAALGDSHNFGRRVSLREGRVHKPRTLAWERLVLSGESPLRRLLDDAAERDGLGRDAFGFLPSLEFFPARAPEEGGEVERVELAPLPALGAAERRTLARIVGRSLALWSWLGLSDLHWENLVLGVDRRGLMVFAPLDVEMILADLALPTETKLLPDADPEYAAICRHACGVRRVLPYLGKPVVAADVVAMAGAYRGALDFLDRHARAVADALAALPGLRETPIRVCLRGTDEYVRARAEPPWPPLLDAEVAAARPRRHPVLLPPVRPPGHSLLRGSRRSAARAPSRFVATSLSSSRSSRSPAASARPRAGACARRGCSRCWAPSTTRRSPGGTRARTSRSRSALARSSSSCPAGRSCAGAAT